MASESVHPQETIAAIATPPGRGGVGIVRVAGPHVKDILQAITGKIPSPRQSVYTPFLNEEKTALDFGIAIYFPAPHSFTGDDIAEFQGHGGPVIMDCLLQRVISLGARVAKPGEFSERAFLNDKIDLAQAEAIADLIDSASKQAARCALRSLVGDFSKIIHNLVESLIKLRVYVEAAIDFPDEEIDFLAEEKISRELEDIVSQLDHVYSQAHQGALLREGMHVALAGKPNAGKSSLLNCLSGRDTAIVTEIPGTTRDLLREQILLDGIPLHIIDTAGLRESVDTVEKEGIRRAWKEIKQADRILLLVDSHETTETDPKQLWAGFDEHFISEKKITVVRNKIDLSALDSKIYQEGKHTVINISVKKNIGIDLLRSHLKEVIGADANIEGGFIARRRHIDAIERARKTLISAAQRFFSTQAGELLAEDLRQVQQHLAEITGEFTPDNLLGRIFSSFCIGK